MTSFRTVGQAPSIRRHGNPTVPRKRRAPVPETDRLILLMQFGWLAVGLIAVASFPDLKLRTSNPSIQVPSVTSGTSDDRAIAFSLQPTAILPDPGILFVDGAESLVARTVGHAEGTRTPDGTRTPAYFGHRDPGNGVWNLGSFSFQHCRELRYNCSTPEQADGFQLQRLMAQTRDLRQRSLTLGLQVTLEEELNAIDLANQAPLAALDTPGYPDHLLKAKEQGLKGQDAILAARVKSFWNPQTNRWDAPGLGNTEASIRHDQQRRMLAIARVLAIHQQPLIAQLPSRQSNRLNSRSRVDNPYSFEKQRAQYLWWDAGYWDASLNRSRQIPPGMDPAYDQGFQQGRES